MDDPIERVFALLARYRAALTSTDCTYGCPIGSIALELHEPDPPVRALLAANFKGWIDAIEACFVDAGDRLPADVDRRALALFALTTMEGGVMVSRTDRTLDAFDDAVAMLRDYVTRLEVAAKRRRSSRSLATAPVLLFSPSRPCNSRALVLATVVGTILQVAMVVAGHSNKSIAALFAVGGMGFSLVAGLIYAYLRARRLDVVARDRRARRRRGCARSSASSCRTCSATCRRRSSRSAPISSAVTGAIGGALGRLFGAPAGAPDAYRTNR